MFQVENADFIADKLASELLPLQEFREVTKNADEAIRRRIAAAPSDPSGRIELDVDWHILTHRDRYHVCCADDGDGMTRRDLERYTKTLAVRGAAQNQSIRGNQGMGLKISGPTRHKEGLLIRSLKDGEAHMLCIGWDKGKLEYDLMPVNEDGDLVAPAPHESFPDFIRRRGSGTVVTFLGNHEDDETFLPAGENRTWLSKYLNQRFARLSQDGIDVVVRIAQGDRDDWPKTRGEADARQNGIPGKKQFNFNAVKGSRTIWDEACEEGQRGRVHLAGDATQSIPAADLHWWILPETGKDVSTRTHGGGSLAVLFQNELHDWRRGTLANAHFARMGILFAKNRFTFVLEAHSDDVHSDFARAKVLLSSKPIFESDAWSMWSKQFRDDMPQAIAQRISEDRAKLEDNDPEREKRIRKRLQDVMRLLRPQRLRLQKDGKARASGVDVTGPGDEGSDSQIERSAGAGRRNNKPRSRGFGALRSEEGTSSDPAATHVHAAPKLIAQWVSADEARDNALVSADDRGLGDRAAALAGSDALTASVLLLNRDFRGFSAMVAHVAAEVNPEGDDGKAQRIEDAAREWIEQKMLEAVLGLRQLENGTSWLGTSYDRALSPVALTAVFMADRYHTLREIKKAVTGLGGYRLASTRTAQRASKMQREAE